ncbi:MAG: hypothetical protein AABY83_06745 [Pseudomonadota bacterium]
MHVVDEMNDGGAPIIPTPLTNDYDLQTICDTLSTPQRPVAGADH